MKTKSVAIYCRVDRGGSAEMRAEVLTLQRCRLKQFSETNTLQVAGYYEDNGCAGNDLTRSGLQQLLCGYRDGQFEYVLVLDRDRLYRGDHSRKPKWPFPIITLKSLER